MKPVILFPLLSALFLGGCSTYSPTHNLPVNVAARDFLLRDEEPPSGYGAYGYLLFATRPTEVQRERYLRVAEAYLAVLEDVSQYGSSPHERLMPTLWLVARLNRQRLDSDNFDDPEKLIELYDYARAKPIINSIGKASANGPFLVAWSVPFESLRRGDERLIFDLSHFSDEDMQRAIQIWSEEIARDPNVWNNGHWNIVRFRESCRNFIQKYGGAILAVIKEA